MIPLFKVHIPPNLGATLQQVFDSGMITEGKYSDEFEASLAKRFQAPTSLVNSCTSALTLAYRMSSVGPDTKVISTPMTCMATNEPIHTMGAKIVWADIDPTTGNIDPASVDKLLRKPGSSSITAVVGVHWAGTPFDVDGVYDVLKARGRTDISVIVDAAHALGSIYKGKPVGTEADYVCFSFQAIKHLTTVDGGAITSPGPRGPYRDARIKKLRWFGLDRKFPGDKWSQDIVESGYKFHMNNVNAAIGLEQLKHIDYIVGQHRSNGRLFDQLINNKKVKPLRQDTQSKSAYWLYTVLVDDREDFKKYMQANGIACDIVHFRNDKYSVFKEFASNDLPGTDEFCSKMINIPVGWWLQHHETTHIIATVNQYGK